MLKLPFVCLLPLLAIVAVGGQAAARTTVTGFTKPPTFTPPDGCVPTDHVYGLISSYQKLSTAGRYFIAWTDTYVGSHGSAQEFIDDQIGEIKQAWIQEQRGKVTFAAHPSDIIPGNAPARIVCAEYSVTAAADDEVKHA